MDRQIIYAGSIPLDGDFLNSQRNAQDGLAFLAAAILGTLTIADGLAATATTPASLAVQVGAGSIYTLASRDATAFGSLASDAARSILKQGINLDPTTLALTAPGTAGQSINYLVQAQLVESDAGAVVLPYYNAANPAQPFAGPANAGTSQNTLRQVRVALSAKAGVAAATGTQATPAPDAGNVGLWIVTVANGQATVVAGNIALYPGAPFIPTKLGQMSAAIAAADCRLSKSGANLVLQPRGGNRAFIPAIGEVTLPSAGVSLAPAATLLEGGAPANLTLYYVYLRANPITGALELRMSATGHSTDAATGCEIRTGDSTALLVGMCRLVGGGFVDNSAQRFVASFFNRQSKKLAGGASGTTASTTFVEVQAAGRTEFLAWPDEDVICSAHGSVTNNTTAGVSQAILTADGTATGSGSTTTSPSAASSNPVSSTFSGAALAEGYHYLSVFGNTSTGTSSTFAVQVAGMIRS